MWIQQFFPKKHTHTYGHINACIVLINKRNFTLKYKDLDAVYFLSYYMLCMLAETVKFESLFILSHRMEEGRRRPHGVDAEEFEMREEFRHPRDLILSIAAQFWTTCHARLRQLRKILGDPSFRPPELLDHKTHNVRFISYFFPFLFSCTIAFFFLQECNPRNIHFLQMFG